MQPLTPFFLAATLAILSGCATLAGPTSGSAETAPPPSLVNVFYATGRQPSQERNAFFGAERADLSYGMVDVGIPARHRVGRHEEPTLLRFEWYPNDHEHITAQRKTPYSRDAFYYYLNKAIAQSPGGKVMIFVHGYNTKFVEAARSLGQFANDLKFSPVVLFSWPSQGSLTGYTVDETNVEWAQSQFLELLNGIIDRTPAKDIYVVGHSMGTRLIARGMTTLASDRPSGDLIRFREIVLVAPDIDSDVFRRDVAPRLARTNIHVTLYASSGDNALMASKAFHGYARAGDSGEGLVVVPGVETIDASIATGGFLGHNYFTEDPRIMEDIFSLLQSGQRADKRFALHPLDGKDGRHWVFRK
ncbi:MAG: alpha/beta fold hydrolase [Gammaproteobacteria bacterium]|nr:alpha/beta fold hydrolase [Gammaproteobacteria bacterium]MBU1655123.1 alpha/beta fold hydrolase [Gammaproteobacteria bacterium]MBU1961595.1 alpha/beta fold hydrolase [Gammaproteobacteria bacterium]